MLIQANFITVLHASSLMLPVSEATRSCLLFGKTLKVVKTPLNAFERSFVSNGGFPKKLAQNA